MSRKMKSLIKIGIITCLFLTAPLIGEQIEETYWIGYAAEKVEPVMFQGGRVATSFQLNYEVSDLPIVRPFSASIIRHHFFNSFFHL